MNELKKVPQGSTQINPYSDINNFEAVILMADKLSKSNLLPEAYRNNPENCFIAFEVAHRMNMSPFFVTQNLDVIKGRPSWNSKFVIAQINSSKTIDFLRFEIKNLGEKTVEYWSGYKENRTKKSITIHDVSCVAYGITPSGEKLTSSKVTLEMAVKEGWYTKIGSKWPTMPEVMLKYRSAKFFGNIYCPERILGLPTSNEVSDIDYEGDIIVKGTIVDPITPKKMVPKTPKKVPNKVPNKAPEKVPNKTPEKVPNETPEKVPNEAPNNNIEGDPNELI